MSNEMKDWLVDREYETNELYNKLVCALTHDLKACVECKKCKGDNSAEIRMDLVRDLAEYMEKDLPWTEEE